MISETPEKTGRSVVNVFIVSSPLHYFLSEVIVRHFEKESRNYLFYNKPGLGKMISGDLWEEVRYLPWPRFDPEPGLFGRMRQTRRNLEMVSGKCRGAGQIRLHTAVIDTEGVNYHIHHLKKAYPKAAFAVRLIPDGILNIRRHPMGKLKELYLYLRKLRRLIYPDLDYYLFKGDRTGSDCDLVDKIYILPGFPHEYSSNKVVELPPLCETTSSADPAPYPEKALVLGNIAIALQHISEEVGEKITRAIHLFLKDTGVRQIDYKPHPKEVRYEHCLPGYRVIEMMEPLEPYLVKNPYPLVIGICSTGLITAKLLLGPLCRSVVVGLNLSVKDDGERHKLEFLFRSAGVEILNVE